MKRTVAVIGALIIGIFSSSQIMAAISSGIAIKAPVEPGVLDGSLMCSEGAAFEPCQTPYSTNLFGVLTDTPVAAIEEEGAEGRYIVSSGKVTVRVSEGNGKINTGDLLTSSDIGGVAYKATQNGYVLGTALQEMQVDNESERTGRVEVLVNIHLHSGLSNARSNLIEYIRSGIEAPIFEPLASLRYVLAALLILLSFVLGFVYFGRMARAGVEAIGRNPLASRMIQLQIALNVLVLVVVVGAGVFAAYLVLIL